MQLAAVEALSKITWVLRFAQDDKPYLGETAPLLKNLFDCPNKRYASGGLE
jgi:hypothetical protein